MTPPQDDENYVDVTVVEFAAHTAYLDPETGAGYLVLPRAETDVEALVDPLVEAAWSGHLSSAGETETTHLSLHTADRYEALAHLDDQGWCLLRDEAGEIEVAGRTVDGRQVLCIYGPAAIEEPSLEALDRAIIALDIAANLDLHTGHRDDPAPW